MVRAFTARRGGVCRICQEPITPGQRIVSWMAPGCYAHAAEAADVMARSEAESRARRNDREFAAMYVAFIDRLPIAA